MKITEWNDVERALGALGIQLRTSVDTFKSFDDLLEEIATKWNTFSSVQQAAIGTSLAGTRQREAFTTLMANWGDVSKYEELADNAYGTAIEKMKVYTDSIEAAKTRMSAALDKWVLQFSAGDIMKTFYNAVADVAENLVAWASSIAAVVGIMNIGKISSWFVTQFVKLGGTLSGVGNGLLAVKGQTGPIASGKGAFSTVKESIQDNFITQQKKRYGSVLQKQISSINGLTEQNQQEMFAVTGTIQNILLNSTQTEKLAAGNALAQGTTVEQFEKLKQVISSEDALLMANALLTGTTGQLNSTLLKVQQDYVKDLIAKKGRQTLGQDASRNWRWDLPEYAANRDAYMKKHMPDYDDDAAYTLIASSTGDYAKKNGGVQGSQISEAFEDVGGNVSDASKQKMGKSIAMGLSSVVLGGVGAWAGSVIGEEVGGATGQAIGTTLLGTVTSMLPSLRGPGIIASIGITAITGILAWWKSRQQRLIKEAQEEFQDASEKYNNAKSMKSIAEKYDELSKGVDAYGRNLTLTDEEYSQFLEYSQQLVEVFPELYMRTDEQGNVIAKLGDNAETTADKVDKMTEALQRQADAKMVGDGSGERVLKDALTETFKEYRSAYNTLTGLQNSKRLQEVQVGTYRYYQSSEGVQTATKNVLSGIDGTKAEDVDTLQSFIESKANKQGVAVEDVISALSGVLRVDNSIEALQEYFSEADRDWTDLIQNSDSDIFDFATEDDWNRAYQEVADKIAQLQANIDSQELVLTSINQSLGDYALAYARYNHLLLGLSDDMTAIVTGAVSQVSGIDFENGYPKALSEDDFKARVTALVNAMRDIYGNDPELQALALNANNAKTYGEYLNAQNNELSAILESDGFKGVDAESQKQFLRSRGYTVDEDSWQEQFTKLQAGEIDAINYSDITSSTDYIQALKNNVKLGADYIEENWQSILENSSVEAVKMATQYLNTYGQLSPEQVKNLMWADKDAENVWEAMDRAKFYGDRYAPLASEATKTGEMGESALVRDVRNVMAGINYTDFLSERAVDEDAINSFVANNFSSDVETVRNSIANTIKAASEAAVDASKNGGEKAAIAFAEGIEDGMPSIDLTGHLANAEKLKELGKQQISFAFGDLSGVEDAVDTWAELKTVFEEIDGAFDTLTEAMKEQNSIGHLSAQTVLSMLSANENYIQALEVTTNGIRLKSNAEEIMASVQLEATKTSIQAMIAEQQNRAESIKQQILQLDANNTYIEQTEPLIESLNDESEAVASTTNNYIALARAINAANKARRGHEYEDEELDKLVEAGNYKAQTYEGRVVTLDDDAATAKIKELLHQLEGYGLFGKKGKDGVWEWIYKYGDETGAGGEGSIATLKAILTGLDKIDAAGGQASKAWKQFYEYDPDAAKEAQQAVEDLLDAIDELIDKEWEAMQALRDGDRYTEYFTKKRDSLKKQLKYYQNKLNTGSYEDDNEKYETEKKILELKKEIRNLDDEEVEDWISLAELQGGSLDTLIELQYKYLETADTAEEIADRQKELVSLLQQELELRKEINDWYIENDTDYLLSMNGLNASTNSIYKQLSQDKLDQLADSKEITKDQIAKARAAAVNAYLEDQDAKIKRGEKVNILTAEEVAQGIDNGTINNDYTKTLREKITQYHDDDEKYRQAQEEFITTMLEDYDRRVEKIQKIRPNEWYTTALTKEQSGGKTTLQRINESYLEEENVLQERRTFLEKQLEDTSNMTSEQVQKFADELNETILKLKELGIDKMEAIKDTHESYYSAIKYEIELMKDELQDAIDDINDAYDDQLNKLCENNDELQRQANLEDLLAAKKRANQEKEKVYRQGLGWVYESPRSAQKEAQDNLDDFYRQDQIDDLEKTRDAEIQVLNDRIEAWDLYLKHLEWQMNEHERIRNGNLVMELLGVDSLEAALNMIKTDMETFNLNAPTNYKNFNTIFQTNLVEPYKNNLGKLDEANQLLNTYITAAYKEMGYDEEGNPEDEEKPRGTTVADILASINDKYEIELARLRKNIASTKAAIAELDNLGSAGSGSGSSGGFGSGGRSGSGNSNGKTNTPSNSAITTTTKPTLPTGQEVDFYDPDQKSNAGKTASGTTSGVLTGAKTATSSKGNNAATSAAKGALTGALTGATKPQNSSGGSSTIIRNRKNFNQIGFYSNGIESGPVTYTGLAMLHGSHSSPEYVLNSEQAYNILRNMATTKLPEMTSNMANQNCGTSYVVQGDVVLENVNDPAEFWDSVTDAMRSRYNVTKNSRG